MQRFTTKIVDLMKQEKLYASQGGPIILSQVVRSNIFLRTVLQNLFMYCCCNKLYVFGCQIENEYGNIDSAYGAAAKSYIKWSASMALSLDTGVPWNMCQQADAPDPMVSF